MKIAVIILAFAAIIVVVGGTWRADRDLGHAIEDYVRAFDAAKNESDTIGRRYIVDPNGNVTTTPAAPADNGGDTGGAVVPGFPVGG